MLQSFFSANRRLCRLIEDALPRHFVRSFNRMFTQTAARYVNGSRGAAVVDIGAGRECHFLPFLGGDAAPVLIGVDIDEDEIRLNRDLAMRLVGDVAHGWMLAPGSADFLISRSVVEHIHDNRAYFANAAAALRPGGYFINLFPGRYAPFALVNRLLPDALARRVLYFFHPHFRDPCGFKPYYDRCYYSAIRQMLEENGMEVVELELRYYQSLYCDFFVPLYLVSLGYDYLMYLLGVRNLASQILLVARKKAAG
jgi:SAM-dependent methyltransferase